MSSRYYSPELGRFIQPTDVSSLNLSSINGLNLYSYVNNNIIGNNQTLLNGSVSQQNSSLIDLNNNGNYIKRFTNPLSFSVGLATPDNLSTSSWLELYALYVRVSVGLGYEISINVDWYELLY